MQKIGNRGLPNKMEVFSEKPNEIEVFLNDHLQKPISKLTPIGNGEWSKAFSFRIKNNDYIVRFSKYKEDFEKDRIANSFNSEKLPIPQLLEIGEISGQYFAISERAFGKMLEDLDEIQMVNNVPTVINLLDAIRQVDISSSVGYGVWYPNKPAEYKSWNDFLLDVQKDEPTSRTYGWSKKLALFPERHAIFKEIFDLMKTVVSKCPENRYLIHNDLLHYNVLVENERISAVIDWGNSMYGDFIYELALFSFYTSWYPSMAGIDWSTIALKHYEEIGLEVQSFQNRLYCYELRIALDGMAYCALKERWSDFDVVAKRANNLKLK